MLARLLLERISATKIQTSNIPKFIKPKQQRFITTTTTTKRINTRPVHCNFQMAPIKSLQSVHISSNFTVMNVLSKRFYSGGGPLSQNEVAERVLSVVKSFYKIDAATTVTAESHFTKDLGLDSLDAVEMVMAFEDEFCIEIPDANAEQIQTPNDAIKYVLSHPQAK